MSAERAGTRARIPALDGLRGIAVGAVLLFHAGHLRGGFLGVDLFFVLSGFLITGLLLDEHAESGRIALARFWGRRARRLFPALLLVLVGVALFAAAWSKPAQLAQIRSDSWWTIAYAANWHTILSPAAAGYWELFSVRDPSVLEHTWSLAIEEQFYVLWPLIVTLALRRGRATLMNVTAGAATFSLAAMVWGGVRNHDISDLYLRSDTRAFALLVGALLAMTRTAWLRIPARSLEVGGVLAAGLLAASWVWVSGSDAALYRGGLAACSVLAAVAIASSAHPRTRGLARVAAWRPLNALGRISYGVYLWHWPIYLVLTPTRTGISGWGLVGIRVATTIAVAMASYAAVEHPIHMGALSGRRSFAALTAALVAVVAAITWSTHGPATTQARPVRGEGTNNLSPSTIPAKFASLESRNYLPPGDWDQLSNYCDTTRRAPEEAVPVDRAPRVMVVGDSVACFIGAGMELQEGNYGIHVRNEARLGCVMVQPDAIDNGSGQPPFPACRDGWERPLVDYDPDIVVLHIGQFVVANVRVGREEFGACDERFAAWYGAGTRSGIETLSSRGARVVVVGAARTPKFIDVGTGIETPDSYRDAAVCINAIARDAAAAAPNTIWLDLDAYVCPSGTCPDTIDGIVVRSDGTHYMLESANRIGAWVLDQLPLPRLPPDG